MNIIAIDPSAAHDNSARGHLLSTHRDETHQGAGSESLDVKTFASSPFLPKDRQWALRFGADGTVTLVLGMKDYGRGWFSGYFAGLVAARLGVPFHRIRLYYSGTLPAVLQKPVPSSQSVHRENMGPVASAAADTIERLCDLVLEKG